MLLQKLECYGLRASGVVHKWLHSYLTDIFLYVSYNVVFSTQQKIICGVPQGSILVLYFSWYISHELFTIMYADDSNLFLQGPDLQVLEDNMNIELYKISTWLKVNKLSLNIDNTHFIIFRGEENY